MYQIKLSTKFLYFLPVLMLLGCQQHQQLSRPMQCYFEDGDRVFYEIEPEATDCTKKGGQWITAGQADLLRESKVRKVEPDKAKASSGTGFVISDQGHVLTNFHVIEDCDEVRGKIGTEIEKLTVIARDPANDLAVLNIKSFAGSVAKFRNNQEIKAGDGLIVVGYPLPGLLTSLVSVTTGTVTALAGIGDDVRFLQISAPIQAGNSGGPVLDHSGHVVGIVVSKLSTSYVARAFGDIPQNVNFAIKLSVVQNFLRTHGIVYQTAMSDSPHKASDIGDEATKYTIPIECWR